MNYKLEFRIPVPTPFIGDENWLSDQLLAWINLEVFSSLRRKREEIKSIVMSIEPGEQNKIIKTVCVCSVSDNDGGIIYSIKERTKEVLTDHIKFLNVRTVFPSHF